MSRRRKAPPKPTPVFGPPAKQVKYTSAVLNSRNQVVTRPAAASKIASSSKQPAPAVHFATNPLPNPPLSAWYSQSAQPGSSSSPAEAPADDVLFDLEDELDNPTSSDPPQHIGKGQNQMISEWVTHYADAYLNVLFAQHEPMQEDFQCECGGEDPPHFKCWDCLGAVFQCRACIAAAHSQDPTHRIKQSVGDQLQDVELKDLGCRLALGFHREPCVVGKEREILVVSMHGFRRVKVVFCQCSRSTTLDAEYRQLLRARLFPSSSELPSTVFTFNVLESFHLASAEGKMSGGRFYSMLTRLTDSAFPDKVPDRYREFMRVARLWTWLQTRKRAGCLESKEQVSLALRCPACPRKGVNYEEGDVTDENRYMYTTHLSYDGSFQLNQRQRAQDDFDTCLTDGSMFFVANKEYENYLSTINDDAYKNTKSGDCNNHKAAIGAWTQYEGLAVTGVGACSCARHAFCLPRAIVNFFKGERFAYTDYAIGSIINLLETEGCDNFAIFYDIYCHWFKKWWDRARLLPMHVEEPEHYAGGIPKYHIAGHVDLCWVLFSINLMKGMGRLDAEGCERLWADANQAAGSTSTKGSGARIDSLNHMFQDWNWRKITTIASLIVRQFKEAVEMAASKEAQWQAFNDIMHEDDIRDWKKLSMVPKKLKDGLVESVYLPTPKPVVSVTKQLQALKIIESKDAESSEANDNAGSSKANTSVFSPIDWVSEGVEIEKQQHRLTLDIKAHGANPTSSQAIQIGHTRQALQERITRHVGNVSLFYSPEQIALHVLPASAKQDPAAQGKPERTQLTLPSRLSTFRKLPVPENDAPVVKLERDIRRTSCLQALSRVRTTSQQKALLLEYKEKNIQGQVKSTRAQSMVDRLTKRVDLAVWEYKNSREALLALGASEEDKTRLQPLKDADLAGLTKMLNSDRSTGEGKRELPWFWTVRSMTVGDNDESPDECNDANRVEWFRGKARYERWKEESMILRREMASVMFSFSHEANEWQKRRGTVKASFSPGYRSYCSQQAEMWRQLQRNAASQFATALKEAKTMNETCARAAKLFVDDPQD
ncbi:hypothetical protein FRC12_020323 [Ceratobasidium sp. 428]|nr:hypothetical protein FRC12_020323 [Ceratobasidium sp. 428]